ncbi:MAG: substrate import-associated zinc metallohydrolase lipoprotein [Aestuariibaculum sp.]
MKKTLIILTSILFWVSCANDELTEHVRVDIPESDHPNDIYARDNFTSIYNTRVIWRRDEINSDINKFVVPPSEELVIPMMKMIQNFWIDSYYSVSGGQELVEKLFPPEIVMLGSGQYNDDGTVVLGLAEGGVRIILTEVNNYNLKDSDWLRLQLRTIHHEFTHITHQSTSLPDGWKAISTNRTGSNWVNISNETAIAMGYVTPYSSSNSAEDFADFVGIFLTTPKAEFEETYLTASDCSGLTDEAEIEACFYRNDGIETLNTKYQAVIDYYNQSFGIDIVALRDDLESRIAAAAE